ncbi:MAG: molybdate ABC transporter substrate-binding protein, partial [Gammaproteobacteria bacterium]|nr:molybdate ABC transporter substrate-binding protein [Gammaproteobacteria bacterium]
MTYLMRRFSRSLLALTLSPVAATSALPAAQAAPVLQVAAADLAPYGRAARAALQQAGLWDSIKPKLVLGENIAQTAQFISTGNAQVGLVGSAHIRNAASNSVWKVPAALYPRIEQGAIVTAKGRANPLAAKYLDFLRS